VGSIKAVTRAPNSVIGGEIPLWRVFGMKMKGKKVWSAWMGGAKNLYGRSL
jgi:hypothetical protein